MLSKKRTIGTIIVVCGVLAAAAYDIDRLVGAGAPLPDLYAPPREEDLDRPVGCDGSSSPDDSRRDLDDFSLFLPRAGSDTVILYPSNHVIVFDSASPTELNRHDRLILRGRTPAEFEFSRFGPHLLICGSDPRGEIILIRQYCRGTHLGDDWNNEIEEIRFPEAREIWLRDDLFEYLLSVPNGRTPASEDIADELDPIEVLSLDRWTLKPFRDVLPGAWLSSVQCRLDWNRRQED